MAALLPSLAPQGGDWPGRSSAETRRPALGLSWWAVLCALILHLLAAVTLSSDLIPWPVAPEQPPAVTVDLVPAPPAPRKPAPAPVPTPPPPPPSPPKPVPPPEPPPVTRPRPLPPPPLPPKLHLHAGRLARHSTAGEARGSGGGMKLGNGGLGSGKGGGDATESERDMILRQILPLWRPPPGFVANPEAVVELRVMVLANGQLASPFAADEAWAPERAIVNYESLPPGSPWRQALVALYLALRLAQPLHLPPALAAKAPFRAVLDFRPADLH